MKEIGDVLRRADFPFYCIQNARTGEMICKDCEVPFMHSVVYTQILNLSFRQHHQKLVEKKEKSIVFQDLFGLSFSMMYFKEVDILCMVGGEKVVHFDGKEGNFPATWLLFQKELNEMPCADKKELKKKYAHLLQQIQKVFLSEDRILYQNIVACLTENFSKRHTLQTLSRQFLCSTRKIYSVIRQHTGKNFCTFYLGLRMEEAQILLKNEEKDVYEVMEKLGYAHRSSFNRAFKKYFGYSPVLSKKGDYKAKTCSKPEIK